jgi:hypothetical protein
VLNGHYVLTAGKGVAASTPFLHPLSSEIDKPLVPERAEKAKHSQLPLYRRS